MYFLYDSNTFVYDKVEPTPGQMPTKDNRPSTNDIVLMEAINKHRSTLNLPTIPPNDDAWLVAALHNWDLTNNNTGWGGKGY